MLLAKDSRQGDVSNFDILIRPFVEELDAANLLRYFFGKDHIPARIVDLDFGGVRHAGQTQNVLCGMMVVRRPGLSKFDILSSAAGVGARSYLAPIPLSYLLPRLRSVFLTRRHG